MTELARLVVTEADHATRRVDRAEAARAALDLTCAVERGDVDRARARATNEVAAASVVGHAPARSHARGRSTHEVVEALGPEVVDAAEPDALRRGLTRR